MLDRTIAPEVTAIGNLSMPKPLIEKLENGAELWICGRSDQEISQLSLIFPGGAAESGFSSIGRLAAMTMTEGTSSKTGAEISEVIDFYGVKLGVTCSTHHLTINASMLNSVVNDFYPVLEDIILNPEFPEQALGVMKQKLVKSYMLSLSKVSSITSTVIDQLIMGYANPLAKRDIPHEIEGVTREMLLAYHSKVVRADGCIAILSGNMPQWLIDRVKELLRRLPAGNACKLQLYPFSIHNFRRVGIEVPDSMQSSVRIGLPAPLRSDPDYVPLRIATIALGGYFGSRLMQNIREDKGYTYGINASLYGMLDGSSVQIYSQTDRKNVEPLISEVIHEMERLASEPMSAIEIESLRQNLAGDLMSNLDGPLQINNYCQTQVLVGIPDGYYEKMVALAKSLDPEIVMEMARKYFKPDAMRIAVAG